MDNRKSQVISDCLHNPLIIKKVMGNFSNTGLLTLSLVNKLWNHEAKSLMRSRGNLFPSFKLSQRPMCQDLGAFASDLQRMTVVPFCGMKISPCDGNDHKGPNSSSFEILDPSYNVILDRLPWKQFSIELNYSFDRHHRKCPTIQLAKRVLRDFSGVLEELSVSPTFWSDQFIQEFLQDLRFPRLKVLKFGYECAQIYESDFKLIKALVSRAPNLEELRTKMEVQDMAKVLEGSSAKVVPSLFGPFFTRGNNLPEDFANVLKVKRMALLAFCGDSSLESFRIVPLLLQTYRTTLNYLRIDMAYLGPLMRSGIILPNVKQFQIDVNFHFEPPRPVVALLKAFDFTRILPRLTTVDITADNNPYGWIPEFLEQGNAVLDDPMLNRAANINHLRLIYCLNAESAPFLAEIWPSIEKLSVKQFQSIQVGIIWEHWPNIKKLEITNHGQGPPSFTTNVDSVLCGIFPEEVAELGEKDDEYLRSVNIVPVMPSIACCKELRSLKLFHEQQLVDQVKKDPNAFCSRVAGLITFARCPNLSVTIQVNLPELEEALGHMKPYSAVVLERRKWDSLD